MKTKMLIVNESNMNDVMRGIARIPLHIADELNLQPGDMVEIEGRKKTYAIYWPSNETTEIIRIDGIIRKNAEISLDERVSVKKAKQVELESLTLVPYKKVSFSEDPSEYFKRYLIGRAVSKSDTVAIEIMGNTLYYSAKKLKPEYGVITPRTRLTVELNASVKDFKLPDVSYEDIGGLKKEIEAIREIVEVPIKHPELFQKLGIKVPKGVLLTGPPGTGKTLLAKAVANETDSNFFEIAGPEIMSKFYGESEKKLREVFSQAEKKAPSIIFIDEIDSIAPKREETHGDVEKRVVSQLLTLMDGIRSRGDVIVIATTNLPDSLDPALRRPGRFDREIRIMPPDEDARYEILQIHTRGMPLDKDVDLKKIAKQTYGFTGADLELLCKEAAMSALKQVLPKIKDQEKIPVSILDNLKVTAKNFREARNRIEPTAAREVIIKKPNVSWDQIGGLSKQIEEIKKAIEWPLKYPEYFKKAGIKPSKGILLYGPPGTGKTMIAKAIANETNTNFIAVKGPEILSKWVGESEKAVREIFKKARMLAPTIIFFDEFDAITKNRTGSSIGESTEKIVNQLLTEMDGLEDLDKVVVVAATNRKDLIDPAVIRPGRFDLHLEVPMPDKKAREQIFEIKMKARPSNKIDYKKLAEKTNGFTGADIEVVVNQASLRAVERKIKDKKKDIKITQDDLEKEIEKLKNQR